MAMQRICDLINDSETWLMERILNYAKERNYTPYTSTLAEAWRASIAGLSESLVNCIRTDPNPLEFSPHQDHAANPGTAFGIREAHLHRARGIDLGMFLGLMKYYRQSYHDLLEIHFSDDAGWQTAHRYVSRFFDAIEIGFVAEWLAFSAADLNQELQETNRRITSEKNKYLTIFESIPLPVILLDREGCVENTNTACGDILGGLDVSGATYYGGALKGDRLPFLEDQISLLVSSGASRHLVLTPLEIYGETRHFQVHIRKMLDVSDKFSGFIIILLDVTEETRAQEALEYSERVANILLEAPRDFAMLIDTEGRVLAANEVARYHLGKYGDKIIGASWRDLTDPGLLDELTEYWHQALSTGETVTFDYEQGKSWRSCTVYPIRDEKKAIEFAVFIRDITERRIAMESQMEAERRAVEVATLRAAAGTTAHEINNPLTGIMAIFQEFMETTDPEHRELARTGLEAAQRIKLAVEKMARIRNPEYRPYLNDRMILDLKSTDNDGRKPPE